MMTQNDYNILLFEKMRSEYNEFVNDLKNHPAVDYIIEHCYEQVIKDDIVTACEFGLLEQDKAKALCSKKYPLQFVYDEWLKNDMSYSQMIMDTIDDSAKRALKEQRESKRESR